MKVLLVRPPRRGLRDVSLVVPPLGLAYVAAALLAHGHRVEIIDGRAAGLGWRDLERRLAAARADLVGVSALSPVADLAARVLRLARPHARWLMVGGPHPTAVGPRLFAEMPEADLAIEGEAEHSAPEALAWLEAGAAGPPPAGVRVVGRSFQRRSPPDDLDALPGPARQLLPGRGYHHLLATRRPMATVISSRGCPHGCTFCDRAVGGRRWRARSAEHVLRELDELARQGTRFVTFYDDNFTHDPQRVAAICRGMLDRELGLAWNCEARVDGVDAHLLGLMAAAGCQLVAYGVESAWEPTLRALGKGFDRAQVQRAFRASREAGLRTLAYVILGSPGESPAQLDATLRFCRHLRADFAQFSTLAALPGATLGAGEPGGVDVRSFLDADLQRRCLSDLPARELSRWLRHAWCDFYLRPAPLARLARAALESGAWVEAPWLAGVAVGWLLSGRG